MRPSAPRRELSEHPFRTPYSDFGSSEADQGELDTEEKKRGLKDRIAGFRVSWLLYFNIFHVNLTFSLLGWHA